MTTTPDRRQSPPVCVVQTWFLQVGGDGIYVVELARPERPRGPRLVVSTTDRRLYQTALEAEGSPERFLVTYHQDGIRLALDALVPAPQELPQ